MNKITLILILGIFMILALSVSVSAAPKLCNDGLDNDGDGLFDWPADAGCSSRNDNTETNPSLVCDNGLDDDLDGFIDTLDTDCQ